MIPDKPFALRHEQVDQDVVDDVWVDEFDKGDDALCEKVTDVDQICLKKTTCVAICDFVSPPFVQSVR
jgi:hypothetical protein